MIYSLELKNWHFLREFPPKKLKEKYSGGKQSLRNQPKKTLMDMRKIWTVQQRVQGTPFPLIKTQQKQYKVILKANINQLLVCWCREPTGDPSKQFRRSRTLIGWCSKMELSDLCNHVPRKLSVLPKITVLWDLQRNIWC